MPECDEHGVSAERDHALRLWLRGLNSAATGNAQAFGYSVTVTVTFGVVSSAHPDPSRFELISFALAVAMAFSLVNLLTARISISRGVGSGADRAVLVGTATDFFAVGGSVGVAIGIAHFTGGWTVWVLAPFAASIIYVLVQSVELAVGQHETGGGDGPC